MCRFHRRDRTSCMFALQVAIWRVGTASPSRRDRQFESPFLQQRVTYEPENEINSAASAATVFSFENAAIATRALNSALCCFHFMPTSHACSEENC
jgi:hypothetical protein